MKYMSSSRIVRPDIAVITNIDMVMGLFGSLANTARANLK